MSGRGHPALAWPLLGSLLASGLAAACRRDEPPASEATRDTAPRKLVERPLPLAPGTAVEARLAGGETHAYRFELPAGRYAGLVVDQRGIDVVATLVDVGGHRLTEVDSPNGDRGPEPLPVLAEATAAFGLEVSSLDPAAVPGAYAIVVEALRPATAEDRTRVAAERAFATGEALRRAGDRESLSRAAATNREALALYQRLGDRRRQADTLYSLGRIHLALGEPRAAAGPYEEALALYRALGARREARVTANGLATALSTAGEPRRAIARLRAALAEPAEAGERDALAIAWNNLGRAHASLGEVEEALAAYERALAVQRQLGDRAVEAAMLANLGRLYALLGDPERATDRFEPALAHFEAAGMRREAAGVLTDLGLARGRSGRTRRGIAELERALALHRELGSRRAEAATLNNLGWLHRLAGDRDAARAAYERALAIFRRLGDPARGITLTHLGRLQAELGDPRAAMASLDEALPLLAASGDRGGEMAALLGVAEARRRQGDPAAALAAVARAVDLVESLRAEPASSELRSTFFASKQEVYAFEIDLLMELHRREPDAGHDRRAFEASERARARSLLDLIAASGADLRRGVDPGLLAREAEAARRVDAADWRRRLLAADGAPADEQRATERELRRLLDERERVEAAVRRASPRDAAFERPLALAGVQESLDGETLLLAYALGEERSFLWLVGRDRFASFELPPRAVIEDLARRAHALAAESHRTLARARSEAALAELSRLLLGPVAGRLGGRRLLVSPDGALHYVPFAALPLPGTTTPLVDAHEVVTAPSASALAVLRRGIAGRAPAPRAVAVLADPVFDPADPRLGRPTSPRAAGGRRPPAPGRFARLPHTRAEAEAILALVPPAEALAALGLAANRAAATGGELARYRVVHFATHGIVDTEHPELSGVALSMVDAAGRPRDGFLRAHEIYRLALPAELVVLSACETALGREVRGEGLVGLTHGFLHAGARRVLVSLWPVEDRATAALMERFYRAMLVDGHTPATALRLAQMEISGRRGWSAPYYWAGFVLTGDWR